MQEHHTGAARPRSIRRVAALAALAVVMSGLALAGAPAAQAAHWDITTFTSDVIHVTKNDRTFNVQIAAMRFGDEGGSISISFSERKNPDGPLSSARGALYSHAGVLSANDQLSKATARIGDAGMGTRGTFNLDEWDPSAPLNSACGGDQVSRRGVFHGDVTFKSGESIFPNLSLKHVPGQLFAIAGDGCGGGTGNPCPSQSISISAMGSGRSLYASRVGNDTGVVFANRLVELTNGWSRSDSVDVTVPGSNLTLNQTERSGTIRGASTIAIRGEGDYSAPANGFMPPWMPCKGGKETRNESTFGELSGNLSVDFLLGGDWAVKGEAFANRTVVRAA